MSELATKYNPKEVEDKWYAYWMERGLFHSEPDEREPFCIVIPPPNVTGVLHMGHMLNNTIQDILVRRARMAGKNALWVPGTDHAAISTEAKVVAKLAQDGIKKTDLSREEFLNHAWDWTNKYGGIILEQLKKLGASCDWQRTAFTMDEIRSKSVIRVFCDLYERGLIYRGVRMVNWDPQALTALSDEEVIYKEEKSKLFYLRYFIDGEPDKYIVVATTRPETILGDTAVCVNPNDDRYTWLKGKRVIVPIVGRSVPVIMDDYVEMEFGTGCLKVTPAHDVNDYMLGDKYGLQSIDIFNDNGTISPQGGLYVGMDRFDVRRKIMDDLQEKGLVEKTEDYVNKVGHSERTDAVIEPKLSMQWFVKMEGLAKPALDAVENDTIKFVPSKYKNIYRYWMTNIKDWCISRQLWWGHQIPAWYLPDGAGFVVAENEENALIKAIEKTGNSELTIGDLRRDPDCLDTWFSSWLWPISLFNGILEPDNKEFKYYYPTSDLVTAPDIIFFWVARMIIAGYAFCNDRPFDNVYFTGIVRDKLGRKMSKSLGNSPDPLELIDRFGADGVRMGLMLGAPAGHDIMYDDSLCEQGRNFCNKIWNAFRLVKGWERDDEKPQPEAAKRGVEWFEAILNNTIEDVDDLMKKYRISEALMAIYKLFWDEFSSWYLEIVKPAYGSPMDTATYNSTLRFFDALLRMLHPFMPFITEELWQHLYDRKEGESIMTAKMPEVKIYNRKEIEGFERVKEIVAGIRTVRKQKQLPQKEALSLMINGNHDASFDSIISKMGNIESIDEVTEKPAGAVSFIVNSTEYSIPIQSNIDIDEELKKLNADLEYQKKFLDSVRNKLSNEKFVANAPDKVVALERKKESDALEKITAIEAAISALKGA